MGTEIKIGTLSPEDLTTNVEHAQNPKGYIADIQGLEPHEIPYNPAGPFEHLDRRTGNLKTILPVRVESADSKHDDASKPYDPRIDFVERVGNNGTWKLVNPEYWGLVSTLQKLKGLEDPSVAFINDQIVLSGVRAKDPDGSLRIRTEFYAGKDLQSLRHISDIPGKDNRLLQLPNGRILVSVRPQKGIAGLGRIGFTIVDSFEDLNKIDYYNVPVMVNQVPPQNWLGANELHVISSNGHTEVGVLGHFAKEDEAQQQGIRMRRYSTIAFTLLNADRVDREIAQTTPIQTIAKSEHLPACGAKAEDLQDVAFPGGLRRKADGTADLYLGVNDYRVGIIKIRDPFRRTTV